MSAEGVGSGFSLAGKFVSGLSPILAAIPAVGPILSVIGELVGEGLGIAGSGITLSAQQTAAIVGAVRNAIDVTKKVRAETSAAHNERTAETQHLIDDARQKPIVEASTPSRGDATNPGG